MVNTKNSLGNKAISPKPSTDGGGRAPAYVWYFHDHKWKQRYDPKAKRKVSSSKPQAPIFRKRQALQASSHKLQALSYKPQAPSHKPQAPRFLIHGTYEND